MTSGFAVLLGLIQALTEFLPISSSGHLSVLQNLFGVEEVGEVDVLFDVMLHFGTLISVAVMYRRDILDMIKAIADLFRRRKNAPPEGVAGRGRRRVLCHQARPRPRREGQIRPLLLLLLDSRRGRAHSFLLYLIFHTRP